MLSLPIELICEVLSHINVLVDLHSLILTCKDFNKIVLNYKAKSIYTEELCIRLIQKRKTRTVSTLLKYQYWSSEALDNILSAAFNQGCDKTIRLLLRSGKVNLALRDNMSLRWVCGDGDIELVRLLLASDQVDPGANNNIALRVASATGHVEIVKMLLGTGKTDPADLNNEPLQYASTHGHTEVVKLLLDTGKVNPGLWDGYILHVASANGHAEVVQLLLERGQVDPTTKNNHALRAAIRNGHSEVVQVLLDYDRSANITPSRNRSRWSRMRAKLWLKTLLLISSLARS